MYKWGSLLIIAVNEFIKQCYAIQSPFMYVLSNIHHNSPNYSFLIYTQIEINGFYALNPVIRLQIVIILFIQLYMQTTYNAAIFLQLKLFKSILGFSNFKLQL